MLINGGKLEWAPIASLSHGEIDAIIYKVVTAILTSPNVTDAADGPILRPLWCNYISTTPPAAAHERDSRLQIESPKHKCQYV